MNKTQLLAEVADLLQNELGPLQSNDEVTEDYADSIEAAVDGLLTRVRDDAGADEDDEDEDGGDAADAEEVEKQLSEEDADDKEKRVGELKGGGHSSGSNTEVISSEADSLKSPNRK